MSPSLLAVCCALLLAPAAQAKGKASKEAGAPKSGACPAADKVNTEAEEERGCKGSFVQGAAAADWKPATEAEYLAQVASSTDAFNKKNGKSYKPQGKSSYVPGQGNGGVRCPKYYKYAPRSGASPAALHRIYDSRGYPKATIDGKYWTFADVAWRTPTQKAAYRKDYAICTDWNQLDKHVGCKLKPGTIVAAGPGESLRKHLVKGGKCESVCSAKPDESYPAAADVQVVLHNAAILCEFTQ
jgi:hypothetical protein